MDLSELIRSVARKRWEKVTMPYSDLISNKIVEDVKELTRKKSEILLTEELNKIRERLKDELE